METNDILSSITYYTKNVLKSESINF
jgi:hypothetical protein